MRQDPCSSGQDAPTGSSKFPRCYVHQQMPSGTPEEVNMHSECQEVINCVCGREIGRPRRPSERSAAAGRASLLRVASFSHTLTSCLFIIDVFPSVSRPQEGDFCSSGRRAATITPLPSFSFSLAAAVESLHFEFILETSEREGEPDERGRRSWYFRSRHLSLSSCRRRLQASFVLRQDLN